MKTENYQVGSVIFTENGVHFCKAYDLEDLSQPKDFKEMNENALKCALAFVHGRLVHCETELQKNIATATFVSEKTVVWKGGRFTVPVHKHLVDLVRRLSEGAHWEDLDGRDLQQILRALYFNSAYGDKWFSSETKAWTFNIASELLMKNE